MKKQNLKRWIRVHTICPVSPVSRMLPKGLGEYYLKENQKLYELLGVDFKWELGLHPKKLRTSKSELKL